MLAGKFTSFCHIFKGYAKNGNKCNIIIYIHTYFSRKKHQVVELNKCNHTLFSEESKLDANTYLVWYMVRQCLKYEYESDMRTHINARLEI